MTDLRQAALLALEALEFDGFKPEDALHRYYVTNAIKSIRAALADQPQSTHWEGCDE